MYNNVLPGTINAGEALYAIVDGVVYQIVSGTAGETTQLTMPVVAAAVGSPSTTLMNSKNLTIGQASLNGGSGILINGDNNVSMQPGAFALDSSLLLDQSAITSYPSHNQISDSNNQMKIVVVPDSYTISNINGTSVVSSVAVCQQQYVQSQFDGYGHAPNGMTAAIQTSATDFIGANAGAPSEAEVLELLAQASSTLPSFQPVVCRTILADECSSDTEFEYLASDSSQEVTRSNGANATSNVTPFTGFMDSFLSFVNGIKVETLSTVANSTIVRRPPLPRYIPDPVRRRVDVCETPATASDLFPHANHSDDDVEMSISRADGHSALLQSKRWLSQSVNSRSSDLKQDTHMEMSS